MKFMTRSEMVSHNRKAHMYHDLFEIIKIISGIAAIISLWFTTMSIEANEVSICWIISSVVCTIACGISAYLYEISDSETIKIEIIEEDK